MTNPFVHWHPVLLGSELGRSPVRVTLGGRELVVFRTAGAGVGALDDCCPHRRMRLSAGRVDGDRIVCPYHGWTFLPSGEGVCPGEPGASICAEAFQAQEHEGAVWVTGPDSRAALPTIADPGFGPIATLRERFRAPLELCADNFAEMEHTGETHRFFGYDTDQMSAVDVRTELGDGAVRIITTGPQRRLPRALDWLKRVTGSRTEDLFVDDTTFHFSPVHATADSYWIDARTRERRPLALRGTVVLTPVTANETDVFAFFFVPTGLARWRALVGPLARAILSNELRRDRLITEQTADLAVPLDGMKLSRFDAGLRAVRDRIERVYHGRPA